MKAIGIGVRACDTSCREVPWHGSQGLFCHDGFATWGAAARVAVIIEVVRLACRCALWNRPMADHTAQLRAAPDLPGVLELGATIISRDPVAARFDARRHVSRVERSVGHVPIPQLARSSHWDTSNSARICVGALSGYGSRRAREATCTGEARHAGDITTTMCRWVACSPRASQVSHVRVLACSCSRGCVRT